MAQWKERLPENTPGTFFVDRSCIDCDACRQLAPTVFGETVGEQSFVLHQPEGDAERLRALMALIACPTASIGTTEKLPTKEAIAAFPERIADEVYFCGFHSEASYGASSYLIRRPGGNVLVDSPRAAAPLLRRLEALGGVATMFLTHRDDVADHQRFRDVFGCTRVMHAADMSRATRDVERVIEGDAPVALAEDLLAIPVPGHTRGSMALLFEERFLFTGDHLWWSDDRSRLHASRGVCWHSWPEQLQSLERLLAHRFEWVLPGHGRRHHAPTVEAMHADLTRALSVLRHGRGAAG
jgi:glyoxylase-like metal-dependent hydrolase (beta-lactamase superfamily II)/ferredoxin